MPRGGPSGLGRAYLLPRQRCRAAIVLSTDGGYHSNDAFDFRQRGASLSLAMGYGPHLFDALVAAPLVAASVCGINVGALVWRSAFAHGNQLVNLEAERMTRREGVVDGPRPAERLAYPAGAVLCAKPPPGVVSAGAVRSTGIACHPSPKQKKAPRFRNVGPPHSFITIHILQGS